MKSYQIVKDGEDGKVDGTKFGANSEPSVEEEEDEQGLGHEQHQIPVGNP